MYIRRGIRWMLSVSHAQKNPFLTDRYYTLLKIHIAQNFKWSWNGTMGHSQPHNPGWTRFPLSSFLPQILIIFSSFSSNFCHFLALRVGKSPTRERLWLRYWWNPSKSTTTISVRNRGCRFAQDNQISEAKSYFF